MAMDMAGFTGSEAEELRRALSYHRSQERMNKVCVKLRSAMEKRGVTPDIVDKITKAVQSFAVYGFPESHAISFAQLAYASCWLKVHRAPEFYAGLLNNQPMGFYSPATLVKDARRRGVRIRPVSVFESDWFCTVDADDSVRLGFCQVLGLSQGDGERIVHERTIALFQSLADFQLRAGISKAALRALAGIGALNGLARHRRDAQWQIEAPREPGDLFAHVEAGDSMPLAPMDALERIRADYNGMRLTTGPHPMALIREKLPDAWTAADLLEAANGMVVQIAGVVITRQRPGTAKGFVFISLEDETGISNAVVTPQNFESNRLLISEEPFLVIEGEVQNVNQVIHVKAARILPLHFYELALPTSHDFR
jgi:error-prone DNA polymerase